MSPRYTIVPADPREHRDDVLEIASRNRPGPRERLEAKYRKYYEDNPFGPASLFLAHDAQSDGFVGMTALFPTALRVAGELVPAAIGGDFAVDAGHRGFGPAVALQRATIDATAERGFACAYGSPNQSSEPIVGRAGYADVGRLSRFVKLLSARLLVDRYVRRPRLAALTSVAAQPLVSLASRDRLRRRSARFSVEEPATFDDRFTNLWELTRGQGVSGERAPAVLNWRYEKTRAENAWGTYAIFALVDGADVAGYVVYQTGDGVRLVYDLVCLPERSVLDALLAEFIRDARASRAAAIDLGYVGPPNLVTARLRAFGFIQRTAQNGLRVYVQGDPPFGVDLLRRESWYFMTGDTDF